MQEPIAEMEFMLYDGEAVGTKDLLFCAGKVQTNGFSLEISIEGMGVMTEKGGAPIFLELHDNKVLLHVWADVNEEDPTHTIDLTGAFEKFYIGKE